MDPKRDERMNFPPTHRPIGSPRLNGGGDGSAEPPMRINSK